MNSIGVTTKISSGPEKEIEIKEPSFDGKILKNGDYSITITDVKIIKPGEKGNNSPDRSMISFWYDTEVSPDFDNPNRPISALSAWSSNFILIQDNQPNYINELGSAYYLGSPYADMSQVKIKPGGKVTYIISYELSDLETPVTLILEYLGKDISKTEISINK